jgi:lysyl-tRNA synthetase class 2
MINAHNYNENAKYDMTTLNKIIRKGDIIGVKGHPMRTKTGELSVLATEIVLLSPCY